MHNTQEAKARRGDSWDRRGYFDPDPWDEYVAILNYKMPRKEKEPLLCPHCHRDIEESLVRSHVAREMGKKGGKIGGKSTSERKKRSSARNLEQWRKRQEEKK